MSLKGGGGKGPRRKGNAFELWCAKRIVKFLGGECHRTIMSGATDWMKGDLYARFNALEGWFLECKDRQSWALPAWIEIAREQAGCHPWAVIFKRNHFKPCVALDLDDWLNQLTEEQELRKLVDEQKDRIEELEKEVREWEMEESGAALL